MVQILPEAPSFKTQFARSMGAGLSKGLEQGLELGAKKAQQENLAKMFSGKSQQENKSFQENVNPKSSKNIAEEFKEKFGRDLTKDEQDAIDNIYSQYQKEVPEEEDEFSTAKQAAILGEKPIADVLAEEAKGKIKEKAEIKKFEREEGKKFTDKIEKKSEGLPERELSLNAAISAAETGTASGMMNGAFWADMLGLDPLRNLSGAVLNTAAKTNLIGSLNRLPGARPNQFIEQQINAAFAKPGESQEAQLGKLRIAKAILDMDKNEIDMTDYLSKLQRETNGFVKSTIGEDVRRTTKNYNKSVMDRLAYDLRVLQEKEIGTKEMMKLENVPKGTPLTYEMKEMLLDEVNQNPEKAIKLAEGLGYTIPPLSYWQE